ncbi:MAG: biotin/lipoyl-binding protein, partial [Bacteroidales bacterium]
YEYTAIVEANAVNNIAPITGGRIDKIYVEVGDHVSKGQVVAQMDENSLKQAKAQLDNLELTFKRIDELYKVGGISKSDWKGAVCRDHCTSVHPPGNTACPCH